MDASKKNQAQKVSNDEHDTVRVVTSQRPKHRRAIIISLLLALGIIILCIVLFRDNSAKNTANTADIMQQNSKATVADLQKSFESTSGLKLSDLQNIPITNETFKDADQAYQAALVLYAAGDYPASLQAFAVAESKGGEIITYQFYIDYAAAADAAKQPELGTQLLEKSVALVAQDKSLNAQQQAEQTQSIQTVIDARKAAP